MKERPILFSAPMVRAILDGTKTQTRRIVKLPHQNPLGQWEPTTIGGPNGGRTAAGVTIHEQGAIWHTRTGDVLLCQYGQPHDRLWVRETWLGWWNTADGSLSHVAAFKADGYELERGERWMPSIHMPRKASRILLEVTGVRVERLQDISEADAIAEGIERSVEYPTLWKRGPLHGDQNTMKVTNFPKLAYRSIWEQINGHESWAANPWVWVVEFRRIDQLKAAA